MSRTDDRDADHAGEPGSSRFTDPGVDASVFVDVVLVECPRCRRRASITRFPTPTAEDGTSWGDRVFGARRLACSECGHARSWPEGRPTVRWHQDGRDPFFGLPLWLRAPCCGSTLWAYDAEHLLVIRSWVAADHRERGSPPPSATGHRGDRWEYETWLERLPAWMTSRKHRDDIVRAADGLLVLARQTARP